MLIDRARVPLDMPGYPTSKGLGLFRIFYL